MAYLTTLSACSNLKGAGKDDEGEGVITAVKRTIPSPHPLHTHTHTHAHLSREYPIMYHFSLSLSFAYLG